MAIDRGSICRPWRLSVASSTWKPIRLGPSSIDKLKLQPGEVRVLSPLSDAAGSGRTAGPWPMARRNLPELPATVELLRESLAFERAGGDTVLPVEGANHFSILEQVAPIRMVVLWRLRPRTLSGRQVPAPLTRSRGAA